VGAYHRLGYAVHVIPVEKDNGSFILNLLELPVYDSEKVEFTEIKPPYDLVGNDEFIRLIDKEIESLKSNFPGVSADYVNGLNKAKDFYIKVRGKNEPEPFQINVTTIDPTPISHDELLKFGWIRSMYTKEHYFLKNYESIRLYWNHTLEYFKIFKDASNEVLYKGKIKTVHQFKTIIETIL
jgi:hypothetical protein